MPAVEITLTKMGNIHVRVDYSLMNNIYHLLRKIQISSNDQVLVEINGAIIKMFDENIKTNDDLYLHVNRKLIVDIYDLLNCRSEWIGDFVVDYNDYWEENNSRFPIPEIDEVLDKMQYVAIKLGEIITLDYPKMKKNNMPFAEDLAKYVFKLDRLIRCSKHYGLNDFTEYLDILD